MKDTRFFEVMLRNILGNVDERSIERVIQDFSIRLSAEISRNLMMYWNTKLESDLRRIVREELEKIIGGNHDKT